MISAVDLRAVSFLRDLPSETIDRVAAELTAHDIPTGGVVFEAGEPADALFLVERGFLEVIEPGARRAVASLGPGSVVGEVGLLLDEPRTATVRAVSDVTLSRLARPVVEELVRTHPHVAVALGREMGKRLVASNRRDLGTAPRLVTAPGPGAAPLAAAVAALGVRVGFLALEGAARPPDGVELLHDDDPGAIVELVSVPQPSLDVVIAAMPAASTPAARTAGAAADHAVDLGGTLPPWAVGDVPALRRAGVRKRPDDLARIARLVSGRSIGLALSSGGSKTTAHIGVIRVLNEMGITIDAVAGTSGGAYAAVTFAFDGDNDAEQRRHLRDLQGAFRMRRLGPNIPPRHGLFRGTGPHEMVRRWYPNHDLADASIPVYIIAADLATGTEVILEHGPVADTVRASMSIPGVLDPYRIDGRLLVDGGIVTPFPTRVLRDAGYGFVIGSNVAGQDAPMTDRTPRITETMARMLSSMERELLAAQVPLADVHIRPVVRAANSFDMRRAEEMADIGEATARDHVAELEHVAALARGEKPLPPPAAHRELATLHARRSSRESAGPDMRLLPSGRRQRSRGMALSFVWLTSVRDLKWRWRRFLIAAVAAALVLALTVLLSGIVAHLDDEIRRTVDATRADGFVVADGVPGPFTSVAPLPLTLLNQVAHLPGVRQADPGILLPQTIEGDEPLDAYVIGFSPGGLGAPPVVEGRVPAINREAAVDAKAGLDVGDALDVGGRSFEVVGITEGLTVLGERPNIYITFGAARAAFFGGDPVATTFFVSGTPTALLPGVAFVDRDAAIIDLRRPMGDTIDSISLFRSLLWLVAAAIVGSVLYLSALERSRDMAVLKATGASARDLVAGLVLQAIALSVGASVVAVAVAELLKPVFPAGISLPIPLLLTAPLVAIIVGILGSLAGLRRVLRVDPALAFGGP